MFEEGEVSWQNSITLILTYLSGKYKKELGFYQQSPIGCSKETSNSSHLSLLLFLVSLTQWTPTPSSYVTENGGKTEIFHSCFSYIFSKKYYSIKNRKGKMYILLDNNIPFTTNLLHFIMLVELCGCHQSLDGIIHKFALWYLIPVPLNPIILFLAGYFSEFHFPNWPKITSS